MKRAPQAVLTLILIGLTASLVSGNFAGKMSSLFSRIAAVGQPAETLFHHLSDEELQMRRQQSTEFASRARQAIDSATLATKRPARTVTATARQPSHGAARTY